MHFHHKRREIAMRWILGWYVFCLLTAIPSAARDIRNKHKPNPAAASPKTRLIGFTAQNISGLTALLKLGCEQHLPMGIRYVDLQLAQKPINITLRRPRMQEVIEAIMSHEKYCAWKLAHGFLSVTRAGASVGGQNLLATRLPDFSSPRVSLQQASQLLYMSLSLRLHPDIRGFAGNYYPGLTQNMVGPLHLQGYTVSQILDRIVQEYGDAAWVVTVPAQQLDTLTPAGLWMIIDYKDPASDHAAKQILDRLLKYQSTPIAK
jgi:hypothetical protein